VPDEDRRLRGPPERGRRGPRRVVAPLRPGHAESEYFAAGTRCATESVVEAFDRILVRMPNWLGDVVMATPLLRTLKESQPRAHLAVLVLPSGAQVLEGLPGIDETILYRRKDEHAGLPGMLRLAKELRRREFDLAVSCPNSFSQALLLRLAGVP